MLGFRRAGMAAIPLVVFQLATPVVAQQSEARRSGSGLSYHVEGQGPRNIVLVHGSNLDYRMWDAEVSLLSSSARVLRYDLRGHGESADPTEPYSSWEDLRGLMDEVRMSQAVLIGLSAGAGIVLDFAIEYPERVAGLVLASPTIGGYLPTERPAFFDDLIAAIRSADYDQANEVLLRSAVFQVPESARHLVADMVRGNRRLWTLDPTRQRPLSPPALTRLSELAVPVLVLVGENDMRDIREQAGLLGREIAESRLVTIPDGGHLLNLTSPARFADELSAFLSRLGPPR